MALGKKVCPVNRSLAAGVRDAVKLGLKPCNIVPMGLYPKKAAKSAPEAGVLASPVANCAGAPALVTAADRAAGKVVFKEIMIMAKNRAWLMVCPQF